MLYEVIIANKINVTFKNKFTCHLKFQIDAKNFNTVSAKTTSPLSREK